MGNTHFTSRITETEGRREREGGEREGGEVCKEEVDVVEL
jgi:hypothetical protein